MEPTQQTAPQETDGAGSMMKVTVGALVIAGLAGAGYYLSQNKNAAEVTQTPTDTTSQTPATGGNSAGSETTNPNAVATSIYKDGTYSATGSYISPAGKETVTVGLTLTGDKITDATFTGNTTHRESKFYQSQFAAGFKSVVVGKAIDTLNLDVVNGSSLTPKGFMDAVTQIKAQAKA